jgi:SAM-dependent methyltransferase
LPVEDALLQAASLVYTLVPVPSHSAELSARPDATPAAALRLGGYSFLILFFELALIRYVPGHVRVFGFFLNLVLMATFLGMGVGLLRSEQARQVRWLAVPALLALFGAVKYFANVMVGGNIVHDEYLWGQFLTTSPNVQQMGIVPVATILFAFCVFLFVPLGGLLGHEFRKFAPLHAYSIDVAGSLFGVLAFAVASALWTPPLVWFGVALAIWVLLSLTDWKFSAALAVTGVAVLGLVQWSGGAQIQRATGGGKEYWSPYYRIDLFVEPHLYTVDVNGSLHQYMLDLSPETAARFPQIRGQRDSYLKPLKLVPHIDTVLVMGAGTGNDLALLLQLGAKHIDAVEIDPTILTLGKALHFQAPYADPRVTAYVNDARAYLRRTHQKYDLIVLGTLDSQTLLSGMSSLRLDNYVYTVEAFQSARARLKPGGRLVTYHESPFPYVAAKIDRVLTEAFGKPPLVLFQPESHLFNYSFIAGGDSAPALGREIPAGAVGTVAVPRDDWPYLYLARRIIPSHYLKALGIVLAIALCLVGAAAGKNLRGGFDGAMFFMGAGFLLVETKSVTEMSLLFGSTWTVNLLVFSSILATILIANVLVLRKPWPSLRAPFALLFAALMLAFFIPVREVLWLGLVGQWVVGGMVVALPILFAATIFAMLFRTRANPTRALAYNLVGAIAGGVFEYSSMITGVKALYLIAAVAYLGALWFTRRDALTLPQ